MEGRDLYYCWHFEDTGKQGGHCGRTQCLRLGASCYYKKLNCYICSECHERFDSPKFYKDQAEQKKRLAAMIILLKEEKEMIRLTRIMRTEHPKAFMQLLKDIGYATSD